MSKENSKQEAMLLQVTEGLTVATFGLRLGEVQDL